ncbi:UDP-glucosyl transferase 89B1 [Corchorus olitorius]|uniref:UDP-glucosyl transferase 89B1 n=1 Tax=Corchorus olitorius TaxID=93759 RepID=A0A1R3IM39_9ROSI|nr:UDP-glucosyl transferase 89B1 [Corchorus olitorius]
MEKFAKHDRIWVVGPLSPVKASDEERGGPSSIPQDEVIAWLDSCHVDKSVVYVGFGSQITLTKRQMEAVASALEREWVLVDEFGVAIRVCNGLRSIPDPVKLGQIFVESTRMARPERVRAMELQKTALEAINKGGSSYQALDQLVQQISCFDAKIIRSSM